MHGMRRHERVSCVACGGIEGCAGGASEEDVYTIENDAGYTMESTR